MLLNNIIFIIIYIFIIDYKINHERQNLPEEKSGLEICGLVAFDNKNIL